MYKILIMRWAFTTYKNNNVRIKIIFRLHSRPNKFVSLLIFSITAMILSLAEVQVNKKLTLVKVGANDPFLSNN
jgi:hypothetical protein